MRDLAVDGILIVIFKIKVGSDDADLNHLSKDRAQLLLAW
jgi:hypothetical protein